MLLAELGRWKAGRQLEMAAAGRENLGHMVPLGSPPPPPPPPPGGERTDREILSFFKQNYISPAGAQPASLHPSQTSSLIKYKIQIKIKVKTTTFFFFK